MKINNKVLSIPPYISTSWDRILSLHLQGNVLVIALSHGETVSIPALPSETLDVIFALHATYLEEEKPKPQSIVSHAGLPPFLQASMFAAEQGPESPIRFGLTSLDGLTSVMQHDPSQSNAPDLPNEIIEKISAVANIVAPDEMGAVLPAKSDCNCPHCQITRAITGQTKHADSQQHEEESITASDLHFEEWTIVETSPKLYTVTNKLDLTERYSVFLGNPVGCTCGQEGCEHILAVLKS